jgi:chromosomal replication initiation ATPase DnaA
MPKAILSTRDKQLALSLPGAAVRYDRDSFLISDANKAAWQCVCAWEQSDEPALIVCGPPGSGKTHLAHIAADNAGGVFANEADTADSLQVSRLVVFDNLPMRDPKAFLAKIEGLIETGTRIVLVGAGHPGEWSLGLKDLQTRLEAMPRATLGEPDETLIRVVIAKGFHDRQLVVGEGVIDYAAPRLSRTFAAAHDFVALADKAALEEKRKITAPLAQKVIHRLSAGPAAE